MRVFAIVAVAVLGLSQVSQATAANLGIGPSDGRRSLANASYDDGPYYVTPWGDSFYVECGRPRVPYREDAYGPAPDSTFLGPVGYRCVLGSYAVDPFLPPRCRSGFIRTQKGWRRARDCD
jgi:hypothetical protein